MKYIIPSAIIIGLFIVSCEGQPGRNDIGAASKSSPQKNMARAPYELHGIVDPGMNNMVSFAIQTPTNWKMQQSYTRRWNGSTPINQVYIRCVSPDQGAMIEFLPYTPYYFVDGPNSRSMRQAAATYGVQRTYDGEMQPTWPVDYIKKLVLPQLAQKGLQIRTGTEKTFPAIQTSATEQSVTGYVDGIASNGKQVRVDCVVKVTSTNSGGETYYNWSAFPSVTITDGNIDAVYGHIAYARNSVKFNPSWERRNAQLVRNGNIANDEINQRNANMTRDYYNHVQKTGDEIAAMRNKSSDKRNEAFRDVIGGEAKYESVETGERVRLADKYNHVYKDKQGNYHGSDEQMNNVQFDWEELQRVETKNY